MFSPKDNMILKKNDDDDDGDEVDRNSCWAVSQNTEHKDHKTGHELTWI